MLFVHVNQDGTVTVVNSHRHIATNNHVEVMEIARSLEMVINVFVNQGGKENSAITTQMIATQTHVYMARVSI
tara:strand:+ start:57 stop:275 length:219 start_codon:yes stop_codon:yes gene_type:complete